MSDNVLRARRLETVIDDNCGISKFYAIAGTLADELQVSFLNQVDDVESMDWDFNYKKTLLTLHFDVYGGVSILESNIMNPNPAIREEVSRFLHSRTY